MVTKENNMKSKEQIDKGFIEAFGEERFKIQEAINKLEKTSKLLSDYLEVPEARGLANCRRGYMFVAHSKILQNAITKLALSKPNKKKGRRGLVFALDYYLA